jgi:hypothetical protein
MRRSSAFLFAMWLALFLLLSAATGQVPSTKDAKPGGRHGKFHFMTDEQIAIDANRRTQIRERLTALRNDIDILARNGAAKKRLLAEINTFEQFLDTVEHRATHSAGPVAAQSEQILNEKKGMSHCTMCHEGADPGHPGAARTARH